MGAGRYGRRIVVADEVALTIDHELRRVDAVQAQRMLILALPLGRLRYLKTVAPPNVVPIVHVERQRDHVGPALAQRADQGFRRWTGIAALGGKERADR